MSNSSRRSFLRAAAIAGIGAQLPRSLSAAPHRRAADRVGRGDELRIGLIGCGGRGTGAASQALSTQGPVRLVAMADMFADRLQHSLEGLQENEQLAARIEVPAARRFTGFDAYRQLLATDIDVVLIATPPHFRPIHFEAAVAAGKHVFFEKPVAVDAPGIRRVLAAADQARQRGLAVVSGLQRHHQNGYLEAMRRIHDGQLGRILFARCAWNMGSLWHAARQPEWSDMEWQLRNWLYFTWLSGDHIVEQHVHNLDVVNWAVRSHPVAARGMGGRQVRTDPRFGHIFDHHSVQFEYPDGVFGFSECRQIDGCLNDVSEHVYGADGACHMDGGNWHIDGAHPWRFEGDRNDPYQTEHDDLFASIRSGKPLNEGRMVAESTMTAILGRTATYTGKRVTWDDALASDETWGPSEYAFGDLPVDPVPMPGRPRGK
ncbi:MAG: Gfo/Idh/MocA family protein [Planctomycetota bacterium]